VLCLHIFLSISVILVLLCTRGIPFSGSCVMNSGARRIPKTLFSVLADTTRSCDDEIDLLITWLSIYLMETWLSV
jgi:hypothetical protein